MRLVVAAALAFLPTAVNSGTIVVGKGAAGITLGMTRAEVVAKLGKPISKDPLVLTYSNKNIFDVYLNPATKRVRSITISGKRFHTASGIYLFTNGAIAKLKAQFGKALKLVTLESGEKEYRKIGRFHGKKVFTDFVPGPHGQILTVLILYYPF